MNSLRMICRTFMDWLGQSVGFFPMAARSRFLTSQLICVGVVDIPLLISMMTVKFWAPASQLDDQNTRHVGRDFSRTSLPGVTMGRRQTSPFRLKEATASRPAKPVRAAQLRWP